MKPRWNRNYSDKSASRWIKMTLSSTRLLSSGRFGQVLVMSLGSGGYFWAIIGWTTEMGWRLGPRPVGGQDNRRGPEGSLMS